VGSENTPNLKWTRTPKTDASVILCSDDQCSYEDSAR